jgi:hypothetical protein
MMDPELEKIIAESKARLAAMSPDEKAKLRAAQRQSYVRAEMAFGTDAQERIDAANGPKGE